MIPEPPVGRSELQVLAGKLKASDRSVTLIVEVITGESRKTMAMSVLFLVVMLSFAIPFMCNSINSNN